MTVTLAAKVANEQLVHGSWSDYHTLGGAANADYARLVVKLINVDLAATAYVTGGIPIDKETTGLQRVVNLWTPGGPNPFHTGDTLPPALSFRLDANDPENPLLVIHNGAGELANASTQPANTTVWLMLGGID